MIGLQEIKNLQKLPLAELAAMALAKKLSQRGKAVSLCSIINAKSGKCSEDCRFCVQSAHYQTEAPVYSLKGEREVLAAAVGAKKAGASRFSLVTSGRGMDAGEVARVAELIATIREKLNIQVCASLGILGVAELTTLKEAGMSRYHHNLETSKEFFPRVVKTHTFSERVATIRAAQEAGLEVCAGGILGMGESEDDRVSLALDLRELQVDSVPLNILIPLPGTPMENMPSLSASEILRAIALFRLINPDVPLRLAAGRESAIGDFLGMAFMSGADGMMIGGYLTQRGRLPEADKRFVEEMQKIWIT